MSPPSVLRLAILECDTPQPQTRSQFGGYAGVFTALLSSAARTLDPPQDLSSLLTISAHDVVNDLHSYPALDDVDALLLTGSRHTAFDNDPWILKLVDFTKRALETARIRVVGACFGHQIIGRAVGAGVGKSEKGWEVAVTDVDLTSKGKEIFGLDTLRIHQMHRDVVQDLPPDAIPLGGNAFCPVQGMYLPGRYLTVQGHPEFTNEIISEILFNRHTVGIFTDEVYDDAMERAPLPHDGVAIGRAFLKFIREG
ncbi:Glutamine amidotransferase type 1 [Metarhizium album ARSEF 1941]|uniref:Glutamine amidotransferase type 1 n=1 Tax=Metarhizium album (strain ARSEF 1941) TaxID=1081103 RepID=A0A0B2X044_METAS|nr:Glutamine amidotransferase type 1 [Metarhizium album ARSEF 1941]KHN98460.1 Glutamine amidotransferase type 1 [Metarhizium album ARSEF 1941]